MLSYKLNRAVAEVLEAKASLKTKQENDIKVKR